MFTGAVSDIGRVHAVRETIPLTTREVRPAALDGCSLKIVGWRPVTGEA
jgi:hypothetical protein